MLYWTILGFSVVRAGPGAVASKGCKSRSSRVGWEQHSMGWEHHAGTHCPQWIPGLPPLSPSRVFSRRTPLQLHSPALAGVYTAQLCRAAASTIPLPGRPRPSRLQHAAPLGHSPPSRPPPQAPPVPRNCSLYKKKKKQQNSFPVFEAPLKGNPDKDLCSSNMTGCGLRSLWL